MAYWHQAMGRHQPVNPGLLPGPARHDHCLYGTCAPPPYQANGGQLTRLNNIQAIPSITNHFNSLTDIGWYSASYQLASAVLQPLAGKVYVHFSNKVSPRNTPLVRDVLG